MGRASALHAEGSGIVALYLHSICAEGLNHCHNGLNLPAFSHIYNETSKWKRKQKNAHDVGKPNSLRNTVTKEPTQTDLTVYVNYVVNITNKQHTIVIPNDILIVVWIAQRKNGNGSTNLNKTNHALDVGKIGGG